MVPLFLLLTTLSAAPDVGALRHELDAVAKQIEELKARRLAGDPVEDVALERLLVRSQELAEQIEQAKPRPAAAAAQRDPRCELVDELREQAAALRAEAEELAAEGARVDAAITRALREEPAFSQVSSAASDAQAPASIVALLDRRSQLEQLARTLQAQASILDAAADALERSRPSEQPGGRPP
jgi:hypothetical protein